MAMRNLSKWSDENNGPPTDVTFVFKGVVKKEIRAHKYIFSVVSAVFERVFFGSLKEEITTIEIVDASYEAFLGMIHYMYSKYPFWKDYKFRHWSELRFLASVYYLAEKYNIEALRDKILFIIPMHTHVMSKEGVLETGILAEENVHHEDFSEALYHSIAAFLLEDFHGKLERALYFFDDTEVNRHYLYL